MHVFDRHTESFEVQVLAREVPQAANAALHKVAGNRRGVAARNGQHRHVRVVLRDVGVQLACRLDLVPAEAAADEVGVCVERAEQLKAARRKVEVVEQRTAEVADAEQDRRASRTQSQNGAQLLLELFDVVAIALLTEAAEAVEILPDL